MEIISDYNGKLCAAIDTDTSEFRFESLILNLNVSSQVEQILGEVLHSLCGDIDIQFKCVWVSKVLFCALKLITHSLRSRFFTTSSSPTSHSLFLFI